MLPILMEEAFIEAASWGEAKIPIQMGEALSKQQAGEKPSFLFKWRKLYQSSR